LYRFEIRRRKKEPTSLFESTNFGIAWDTVHSRMNSLYNSIMLPEMLCKEIEMNTAPTPVLVIFAKLLFMLYQLIGGQQ
jgi:hypothetical protein